MEFDCKTYSLYDMKVEPRTSGYLQSINYTQGEKVKEGQLLITIEPSGYDAELAEAEAELATANAAKIKAQNTYNRYIPLWNKRAISRSSLDEAIAALAQAKASVNSAKAQLYNAKLNLGYTKFYAPFTGVIGQTNGAVGQYVGPGTEYEIINTVSNVDSIYVRLPIPTEKYLRLAIQDTLRQKMYNDRRIISEVCMYIADNEKYPHSGVYKFTERDIQTATGAVVIHILFPNPERILKPEQFVRVTAKLGIPKQVILIPQRCVMQQQGVSGVFVAKKNGKVEYRKVELGDTYGTDWEITKGIENGEMILTEGLQKVRSGQTIKPIMAHNTDEKIAVK